MTNLRRLSRLFICALLVIASPAFAADKTKAPVILIVDVQRILQESLAAKSMQKQLDSQRSKFQTETETEENELRQAEQDLVKLREQLSAQAYSDREQQLRQRFLTVERNVDERRKVLDQSFAGPMDSVKSHLIQIVEGVAQERGANMVLVKQQVLWADPSFDVTDEVLARLNKTLPDVSIAAEPSKKPDK